MRARKACSKEERLKTRLKDKFLLIIFRVIGNKVRLPGPSRYEPRIYDFGTPYRQMLDDLKAENESLYRRNGVMSMLERDVLTKKAPERWQEATYKSLKMLNVLICFEERIFDIVVEGKERIEGQVICAAAL